MKKLKGFTLAEVLITLTLIGVVAALTMPSLNVNVQKQQAGPAFMKAINSLESVHKMALHDYNARNFDDIHNAGDEPEFDYLNLLRTYLSGNIIEADLDGDPATSEDRVFVSSDGMAFWLGTTSGTAANPSPNQTGNYFTILIDINGLDKAPNETGKDRFDLFIDMAGPIMPMGSRALHEYDANNPLWGTGCNPGENPTNFALCAGSIYDNGGQIKYKY